MGGHDRRQKRGGSLWDKRARYLSKRRFRSPGKIDKLIIPMIGAGNLASRKAATLNIGIDLDLSSIPVSRWPDT